MFLFLFYGVIKQSVIKNKPIIFSGCEIEQIQNASSNVTEGSGSSLLRHNDVVEYKCNDGYISSDLPIRTCFRGKFLPSFKTKPFTCIGRK